MHERPTHESATGGSLAGSAPPHRPNSPAHAAPWLWTALALTAGAFAVLGLVAAGWHPLLEADAEVARWFHARALAHPAWTETSRVFSDWVWDPITMRIMVGAAAVWIWLRGEGLLALWCVAIAAAGTGVQQGLKALVNRERPRWENPVDSAHYAAMPSGHAMTAAVSFTLVVWLVHRSGASRGPSGAVAALACVSVAGVCLTRLVLGVHWLTDTVVGTLLGVALAVAAAVLWNALAGRRDRRAEPEAA